MDLVQQYEVLLNYWHAINTKLKDALLHSVVNNFFFLYIQKMLNAISLFILCLYLQPLLMEIHVTRKHKDSRENVNIVSCIS